MSQTQQFLFNRSWAVSIGLPGDIEGGKKYTELRVVFDVDKNLVSSANKSKIELYNLDSKSRGKFQKGYQIQLAAGYQGLMETLFIGDVTKATSKREQGSSIVTTFESGEAEKQLVNSHFDKSYPPGTTYSQIVNDLATALGVPVGVQNGITNLVYNSGVSLTGSVKHILDKLMQKTGLEWSVQNGALQIIPIISHNGDTAVVLSSGATPSNPLTVNPSTLKFSGQNTGLIGVPSQGNGFIEFTALLNPRLVPGAPVIISSETVNGFFKIRRAHFEGDSHGEKWQVSCEALQIQAQVIT